MSIDNDMRDIMLRTTPNLRAFAISLTTTSIGPTTSCRRR